MKLLATAAAALVLTAPLVAGDGIYPTIKHGQKVCSKKMIQEFITCGIKDFNMTTGRHQDPSPCLAQYNASFAACRGGFAYLADYDEFGFDNPPTAVGGGMDKYGWMFAYYSFPAQADPPKKAGGALPLHSISCKVCDKFVAEKLKCALPVTPANVTKLPGALYGAIKGCVDLTNANELALWMMCSTAQNLPNGNFPETLKVPAQYNDLYINANGQIDYVLYTPSIVFDGFYQSCPTIEAYADPKTGRKTAKILKGTGFNTVYTWIKANS